MRYDCGNETILKFTYPNGCCSFNLAIWGNLCIYKKGRASVEQWACTLPMGALAMAGPPPCSSHLLLPSTSTLHHSDLLKSKANPITPLDKTFQWLPFYPGPSLSTFAQPTKPQQLVFNMHSQDCFILISLHKMLCAWHSS